MRLSLNYAERSFSAWDRKVRFHCGFGRFSVSLEQIAVGSSARVVDVTGSDTTSLRLLEMGLTPGVSVRVVGAAPLGGPLELELRGYRLSIRRHEAARVAIAQ